MINIRSVILGGYSPGASGFQIWFVLRLETLNHLGRYSYGPDTLLDNYLKIYNTHVSITAEIIEGKTI